MDKKEENSIFKEAVNGYGLIEVAQRQEGLYCDGCCCVHKRPTKMYTPVGDLKNTYCKYQVVKLFNPEE